jgi:GNAT superfamily N-acetyltransferase
MSSYNVHGFGLGQGRDFQKFLTIELYDLECFFEKNCMQCRLAKMSDIEFIMKIYVRARAFMAENGNPHQWGDNDWPPQELIESDIAKSQCYVCEQAGKIVGVFVYIFGVDCESDYLTITDGKWFDDSAYGVIHRLATDEITRGVGSFCINWCYEKAGHLRIDTHADNKPMQGLIRKQNFAYCGIIHVENDNYPRLAYEKSALTEVP